MASMLRTAYYLLAASLAFPSLATAQSSAKAVTPAKSPAALTLSEQRASRALESARTAKASALELEAFLRKMPKAGELHMHLSGAIYAETYLKNAAADGLCVDTKTLSLAKPASASKPPTCPSGDVPATEVFKDQKLYDALVDSFSMRSFVPFAGTSGHDQFFATFGRFEKLDPTHTDEWLDEVATRAAAQNEQYLEIMITPSFFDLQPLWDRLGWPATPAGTAIDPQGDTTGTSPAQLASLRSQLLAGGLSKEAALDIQQLDGDLAARDRIEHCGQPNAAPACAVKIRFIYQILRAFSPQQVFAQTVLGYEVASADPNVLGINFVQPEDAYMAMSEYNRQMHMLDYLHSVYPRVHLSLHAGELAPGMVPPDGLAFHIREAVEVAHAERIGHGVDVMHESDPEKLLAELASKHIMVEINLTSNDGILGITPPRHPLPVYRAAHVPVALSTDDEGVSRIDLTHEYVRAAMEYGLTYRDLKDMARTALEHSFLPGESLWNRPDDFTLTKKACAAQRPALVPNAGCLAFLKSSERASQQWELERRFAVFEAGF